MSLKQMVSYVDKKATLGCKQRISAVRHDKEFKLCELCVVFSHCVSYVLACHFCTSCLKATCKLYIPTLVSFFGFSSSVLILGFVEFIGLGKHYN